MIIKIALQHDVQYPNCLGIIRDARSKGLTTPVLLMGKLFYATLILQ